MNIGAHLWLCIRMLVVFKTRRWLWQGIYKGIQLRTFPRTDMLSDSVLTVLININLVTTTDTTTSAELRPGVYGPSYIQNITIHSGVKGSSADKLIITVLARGLTYSTDYYNSGSKEVFL